MLPTSLFVYLSAVLLAVLAQPEPEPPDVPWRHPVDAVIVDFFRPPSHLYGPGNRGLEYDTVEGQEVWAVAPGNVVFAGQVGGDLFVVLAHGAQLRSTYAYLGEVAVRVGDRVEAGQQVATARTGFHLTARLNGRYVDPLHYMALRWSVRLVAERPGEAVSARQTVGPH